MKTRQVPVVEARRPSSRLAGRIEWLFLAHRHHLPYVHLAMFGAFLLLIAVPPLLPEPAEDATALTHLVPLANLLLWGVWFPLLLLSVVVTGRSWCGLLCPMGAASEWASRHGWRRPVPGWLRWPGTPVLSFVLITILGQTVGVRDHPEAAAEIFGGTMVLAVVVGWLYAPGKRPWCRHACPIGLLLGVFSRLGAVQFAPKRPAEGGDGYTDRGVCPTMIDLRHKRESRHCIECFRCVSPPAPGGLFLRFRRPGEEIEQIRRHSPNFAELWFLFLGGGVALGGFLWTVLPLYDRLRDGVAEWMIERGWYWVGESGPWWLMSVHPARREVFVWIDLLTIAAFMVACMLGLAAVLAAASWTSALMAGWLGAVGSQRRRFLELGYQFAPVAMVSLLLGLGGGLFGALASAGLPAAAVAALKAGLFLAGAAWSVHLGGRILAGQGLAPLRRLPALLPGIVGSAVIAAAWWPALFGG